MRRPCGSTLRGPRRTARRALLACLAVLAAGCAPGALSSRRAPETPPAPAFEIREATLRNGFVTVEVRIPAAPPGPKPAIISPIADEARLLRRGFVVVRYKTHWELLRGLRGARGDGAGAGDAPGAADGAGAPAGSGVGDGGGASGAAAGAEGGAETVGAWLLAEARPGIVGRTYLRLIAAHASTSLPAVIDHLEQLPEVDARRIAVSGSSTGGFTALEALLVEPRLAAGVVRVACGDYHEFLRSSSLGLDGEARWLVDGEIELDADYDAELRAREPFRRAADYPPRPLLMLNGARDPAIPLPCVLRTAEALARAYQRRGLPERFRFVLYEDRGHDVGAEAEQEVLDWWEHWLAPAASAGAGDD